MIMTPAVRKLALTTHVGTSVGWMGALAAFLVLSIAGMVSANADTVRASYLSMNLIGQFMIVPLGLAALITGLVQAFGTQWGLVRYYWVLVKFALTLVATTLLVLHQFTAVAGAAKRASAAAVGVSPTMGSLGTQLVVDASLGLVVLLVTLALSIYKPWGRTRYGLRAEEQERIAAATGGVAAPGPMPVGLKLFMGIIGVIVATILIIHLAGGGLSHH
jgi:hypothetical protein